MAINSRQCGTWKLSERLILRITGMWEIMEGSPGELGSFEQDHREALPSKNGCRVAAGRTATNNEDLRASWLW